MCLSAVARVIKSRRCHDFSSPIWMLFKKRKKKSHCLLMILHDSSLSCSPNWILAGEAKQRIMLRLYYPPLVPHNWFSWSLRSRVMFGSLRRREGFLKFDCVRHKDTWGTSGAVRSELLVLFLLPSAPTATDTQRCVRQTYKKKRCEGGATAGVMTC